MRRALVATTAAVLLSACGTTTAAHPAPHFAHAADGSLRLSDGWASADPMAGMSMSEMPGMGEPESVAYATLTNDSDRPDALVAVASSKVGSATLHATRRSADGSAGTMVPAANIPVPAHGHVTLSPGGFHVMLQHLKAPFAVGDHVRLTWTFRSGRTLAADFPVIDPADRP